MPVKIIRSDVCTVAAARQMVGLVLRQKPDLDRLRGKQVKVGDVTYKLKKADRNILMEVRVLEFPVPLMVKYPNGSDIQPYNAITWESGQWEIVCKSASLTGDGIAPALIAFDEETASLFLEKLPARTAYQTMFLSPLIMLSGSALQQTLSGFEKLGRLLAALHSCGAAHRSPIHYGLEAKLSFVNDKLGQDKALDEAWKVFRQFFQGSSHSAWIHGNLRTDNILFVHGDVALIDLENSGAGDPMEDMGRLIAFLIMFRRFTIFPRRFWETMLDELIKGYGIAAIKSAPRLLACVLGEMLVVYGRDYVSKELTWMQRHFKKVLERSIWNLLSVFNLGAAHVLEHPSLLLE